MLKNKDEFLEIGIKKVRNYGIGVSVAVAAAITINSALFNVEAGEFAVEQTPGGNLIAHMTPGYKFKYPFVGNVWFYDEVTTVTYDNNAEGTGSSKNLPYRIVFSDTYGGLVKGSFRVELSKDPDKLIEIHKSFKSYDNFINSGVEKFTNELLTYTAQQFTGESFMQGGQNEFKNRLEDQSKSGLYVTKRTAVKVSKESGQVSLTDDKASKTTTSEAVVYKNIIQTDTTGAALRQENSMTKYGVTVPQSTISGFEPDQDLQAFMSKKKDMVRKRASIIEDQENERQQAITAKLTGDRQRVEAKQKMLLEKDKAEIELSKQVEVARLQAEKEKVERQKLADLAVIDKKKELQMATDNEGIQKANERAAKYEAQAILHKGLADAQVLEATYKARDPKLYALEKQVEITNNLKDAFKGIKVTMPTNMITTGSSETSGTSVDTIMQLLQLDKLDQIGKINKK